MRLKIILRTLDYLSHVIENKSLQQAIFSGETNKACMGVNKENKLALNDRRKNARNKHQNVLKLIDSTACYI